MSWVTCFGFVFTLAIHTVVLIGNTTCRVRGLVVTSTSNTTTTSLAYAIDGDMILRTDAHSIYRSRMGNQRGFSTRTNGMWLTLFGSSRGFERSSRAIFTKISLCIIIKVYELLTSRARGIGGYTSCMWVFIMIVFSGFYAWRA
jgi:hypothetical protein